MLRSSTTSDGGLRPPERPAAVLIAALRRHPRRLVQLAAWSVVEALPALVSGLAVARALDTGFLAGRLDLGLLWLGLLALAVVAGAVATRALYPTLASIVEPFRDDLIRRVVTGAIRRATHPPYHADTAAVARLTHQVETVRDTFAGLVMVVRSFLFTATSALVGLVSLAPVIALLVTPPLLAGLALFGAGLPALARRHRALVVADEHVAAATAELAEGLRDVVACGAEWSVQDRVGQRVTDQATATRRLAYSTALRTASLALGGWVPVALLVVSAEWLTRQGVTAGVIVGSVTYLLYGLMPALNALIHGVGASGVRLVVTLSRLLETSSVPWALHDAPAPRPRRQAPLPRGFQVVTHGLTFAYGPHAAPILDDLDLVIPEGEHLVIVGPSGIGKSTLAGLLAGLLTPTRGTVTLGDVAVTALSAAERARWRVLIPQEAYLFAGSLAANLTYLRPDAPKAMVDAAVEALGLWDLERRLGGRHVELNSTLRATLSPGERQLIALARCYLSPAPVVILDEATCHLDPVAEARVEEAFARRPGTLIVIAHRISSARRADRILVLDGASTAVGTHHDLVATCPSYRDLVNHWNPVSPGAAPAPLP